MTDKNNPAMPCESPLEIYSGLTAQEYAAIHLKVADSGTPWLDEMIEKARRDEFAKAVLNSGTTMSNAKILTINDLANHVLDIAEAVMLVASKGAK